MRETVEIIENQWYQQIKAKIMISKNITMDIDIETPEKKPHKNELQSIKTQLNYLTTT